MSNALVPMDQMEKMARVFAGSKMFGCKTPEEAMAIMLLAQSEGLHPATAARDYHIIQGRPAMKADAMLSRFLQSGGRVTWGDYTDAKVSATFSHPSGGTVTIDWDQARAKQAGLLNKDNWKNYPRQMLRARVISEGVRTTNPGVALGIYTEAEVEDFIRVEEERTERDMGTAELVSDDSAGTANPHKAENSPPAKGAAAGGHVADEALLMLARDNAEAGIEQYKKWWSGISATQRQTIGPERHSELKKIAEASA